MAQVINVWEGERFRLVSKAGHYTEEEAWIVGIVSEMNERDLPEAGTLVEKERGVFSAPTTL